MPAAASSSRDPRTARSALPTGVLIAAVVFVVALPWAKWLPYARTSTVAAGGAWSGSNVLGVRPGDPPSWHAATSFTWACLVTGGPFAAGLLTATVA